MDSNPDFSDLLQCFNEERVRFLIVGGYAVIFHVEPRFTKDLDVWIDPTSDNAARAWRGLSRFGAPLADVTPDDLATAGTFYLIGVAPNRIDIITTVDGLTFDAAWRRRAKGRYGDQAVCFLSIDDLVRNKRAVGRPQDLIDVKKLEAVARTRPRARKPKR